MSKNTWIQRWRAASQKTDFDSKKFAGRITGERLEVAKRAIRAIATPILNDEANLPWSAGGTDFVGDELANCIESLLEELKAGRRTVTKTNTVVPI